VAIQDRAEFLRVRPAKTQWDGPHDGGQGELSSCWARRQGRPEKHGAAVRRNLTIAEASSLKAGVLEFRLAVLDRPGRHLHRSGPRRRRRRRAASKLRGAQILKCSPRTPGRAGPRTIPRRWPPILRTLLGVARRSLAAPGGEWSEGAAEAPSVGRWPSEPYALRWSAARQGAPGTLAAMITRRFRRCASPGSAIKARARDS